MTETKPIPYRGADYSANDTAFMAWWKENAPALRFGDARKAYDATQDQTRWPYTTKV